MIKETAYAVSERLYDFFGDDYKIYIENVKQGFSKPCFIIFAIGSEMGREQKNRWLLKSKFKIECYTDSSDNNQKINYYDLQSKLYEALAEINVEGVRVFGDNMKCAVNHGNVGSVTVLQDGKSDCKLDFFVNYDMYLTEITKHEPMEKMTEVIKTGLY